MRMMPKPVVKGKKDRCWGDPSGQSWERIEALELNPRIQFQLDLQSGMGSSPQRNGARTECPPRP